jgi:Domain of unknown function (DUF4185)
MSKQLTRRALLGLTASTLAAASGVQGRRAFAAGTRSRGVHGGRRPVRLHSASDEPAGSPALVFIDGSSSKVEQVIGDFDKQLQQPTLNLTATRYGLMGTDLGQSVEHQGKLYFLFGDTLARGAPDPLGFSTSSDPAAPLQIDFLSGAPGRFIPVQAPGVSMGPFEVPGAGLSLNGTLYVAVLTNYTPDRSSYMSRLLQFNEEARSFSVVRDLSHRPDGHFINLSLRFVPEPLAGLPTAEPYVLLFGSGDYRKSNVYLAVVPAAGFTTGNGTRYFAGMDGGVPLWTDADAVAAPIVTHPVVGELGAAFLADPGLWLLTYNSSDPRGIVLRYAPQPWGPWSDSIVIFNGTRDHGSGTFIHDPRLPSDDGLGGPVTGGANPMTVAGGEYAPYLIERFTSIQDGSLTLQYLMSTWNPYTVVRMRSTLAITR